MIIKKLFKKISNSIFPTKPIGRITVILLTLTILCCVFILWNATRTGEQSGFLSNTITENIKDNIENNNSIPPSFQGTDAINSTSASDDNEENKVKVNTYYLEIFIRKSAHLIEYTALVFLLALTLFSAGVSAEKSFIKSIYFGFIIAFSDEIIQSFTEGRTGKFSDVLIDTCGCVMGAFFAIVIFVFFFKYFKSYKTIESQKEEEKIFKQ